VLAEELGAMGFFNKVLPRATFESHVWDYAAQLAAASPEAVQTAKRQMAIDMISNNPAASVEHSKNEISRMMQLPDYREGVAALLEKRAPKF
jgi:enoyl-CoA hydratase/carnithine racemase